MGRKARFTKEKGRAAAHLAAEIFATAFNVTAPRIETIRDGRDWEYHFEISGIWTNAGPAEAALDIDSGFAHLYFRFLAPDFASRVTYKRNRLNPHSGKWNDLTTPAYGLDSFLRTMVADFAMIAEPNPPAWDALDCAEHRAAENSYWRACRAQLAADIAARAVAAD